MDDRPFRLARLLLAALALFAGTAHAWQGEANAARAIERYQDYLARKPFHDWAFDKMVESAVSLNQLAELVERYESRAAEDPEDQATTVVLARLYARTDQHDQALGLLSNLEERDAKLSKLFGELHLRRGRHAEAIAALDEAAAGTDDKKLLEEIHKRRGEAYLAAGEREKAHAAFHALAELDPENFNVRLEAATALAQHGLAEEAIEELSIADELAGSDAQKRCRVLADIGRMHEQLAQMDDALSFYEKGIELMARGNWLKRDLYERILAIHQRGGTLEALIDETRDASGEKQNLDAREFHARVLAEAGRHSESRDVLKAATEDFPGDLKLSRRLLDVMKTLDDTDGLVAEYQRILAERPEELELYIELGQVFASEGRFEQAKLQFERTLEKRLSDAGLCVRLAGYYALFDRVDDAVGMYEKAISLEPSEMRHYADLAAFLAVRERRDDVVPLLERAEKQAGGDASRLSDLSLLWSEYGFAERALASVEAALALEGDDARLLHRLADLYVETGEVERAAATLHQVVEHANESALRSSAVDRILRLFRAEGRSDELVAIETRAIAEGSTSIAPYLVLGKLYLQRREPDAAVQYFEKLLALDPASEDARKALARLYEDQGDYQAALAQYDALMERRPQSRRQHLKEIARIYIALYDQEKAFACYDEILAAAPDNPAGFTEVAEEYERLGLHTKATECLEQAVRLKPEDARIRLDLADAYKRVGEWERAREETLAAVQTAGERDEDEARQRYFVLVSEMGRLDAEIDDLRSRIDRNPYDVEAPLTLIDIYARELEYELALELLDRLLRLQPKEGRLLQERGRIYALMERYDEAIHDFEALWKLPDSDRSKLALEIADASIQSGNLERAGHVLASVPKADRVARLYRKHGYEDEAIAALEKGIAGSPTNVRLLLSLARVQEDVGDREASATTFERILALRGESWKVLIKLGELYHELGRKEDALAVGGRLFSLIRMDEKITEDEDEEEESNTRNVFTSSSSYRGGAQQYAQRVRDLKTFFEGKGYLDDFAEIGRREVALQPSNTNLYTTVMQALGQLERSEDALATLGEVRAATVDRGRTPSGYTVRGWQDSLDSTEIGLYQKDPVFAETRASALRTKREAGELSERETIELAQILGYLRADEERYAVLDEAAGRFPESTQILAALGVYLQGQKEYAKAVDALRQLIAILEEKGDDPELALELELAFQKRRRTLLNGFPPHVQRRVNDQVLRRLYGIERGASNTLSFGFGRTPRLDGARQRLAQCLFKTGDAEGAKAVLATLEPENPEDAARLSAIASTLFDNDLFDEAEAIYDRLAALEETLGKDPLLGFNRTWASRFKTPMQRLARIYEKRGDFLEAYDLLREFSAQSAGELILTTNELFEEAEAYYAAAVTEADRGTESDDAQNRAWRNACVKLAEVLQYQKRWDDALAAYRRVTERLPHDFSCLKTIAALHLRASDYDEAIATHYEIIEQKRALNRRPHKPDKPEGKLLTPLSPITSAGPEDYAFTRLRRNYGRSSMRFNLRDNYTTILKLYLDQKKTSKATDVLRQLAREDASSFRYMSYSIRQLVQNYQLGADAIPILRLVNSYNPDDLYTSLEFGKALVKAKKLDDAHKIFTRILNKGRGVSSSYYRDQARTELDKLEVRMGLEHSVTVAELREAADSDPKNVKKRMKLARRLFKDRDFETALDEGVAAEALAPHLDEVKGFVTDCYQVLGRHEEVEARTRALLDQEKDVRQRFGLVVRLANWRLAEGDNEAAQALFRDAFDGNTTWVSYAPSSWFLEKGDFDRAIVELEQEIERLGKGKSQAKEARARLQVVHILQGRPAAALDIAWEEFERAKSLPAKLTAFGGMAGVLRQVPAIDAHAEALFASAEEHDGLRRALYRAATQLAMGELEELEAELSALTAEREDARFLYPSLVDLARQRGDLRGALAYLERIDEQYSLSEQQTVQTDVGSLSEADALEAEKASILYKLGETDAARAIWDELFDEDDDGQSNVLSKIYAAHELYQEAVDMLRKSIEKHGERSGATLLRLARYERELGNTDEAIALLERARILYGASSAQSNVIQTGSEPAGADAVYRLLTQIYSEEGRVDEYLAELNAAVEKDPDDVESWREIARVALERGDGDRALEVLEALSERPDEKQRLLPFLIRTYIAFGRTDEARATFERMLDGNVRDYTRKRYGKQIAGEYLRAGDVTKAIEMIERVQGDPDSFETKNEIAKLLAAERRYAEAIPYLQDALKLSPKNGDAQASLTTALWETGEERAAYDACVTALRNPAMTSYASSVLNRFKELALELGEHETLAAITVASDVDADTFYRAATIAKLTGEPERAVALYSKILEEDPDDQTVLRELWPCYRTLGRTDDARRTIEYLITLLDREQGVLKDSWSPSWQILELRQRIGELYLFEGDREAALAAWRRPIGNRYKEVNSYSYSYSNSPFQELDTVSDWFKSHGFYDEFVESEAIVGLFQDWEPNRNEANLLAARFRAGDREGALEDAWRKVSEPGRDLVVDPSAANRYFSTRTEQTDPRWLTLLSLFRQEGRTDELVARVQAEREAAPEDEVMLGLLDYVLSTERRWEEVVPLREEALRDSPDDAKKLESLAAAYREVGRYEDAIEKLERALAIHLANIPADARQRYVASGGGPKRKTAAVVKFNWAGSSYRPGSNYFYSSSSSANVEVGPDSNVRRSLMALYKKVGREADAKRCEEVELGAMMLQTWNPKRVARDLAAQYAKLDLAEDAERLYLGSLESSPDLEASVFSSLLKLYQRLDDEAKSAEYVAKILAANDEGIEKDPYDWSRYQTRARRRLFDAGDVAGAKADADRAIELAPKSGVAHAARGWVHLEESAPEAALASFQEAERFTYAYGQEPGADVYYGMGLALADAQGVDAAAPVLRRALSLDPRNRSADRARELLQ